MGEAFLLYLSTILTDECVGGQKQAAPRRRAAVSLRGTVRAYLISWLVQRREREKGHAVGVRGDAAARTQVANVERRVSVWNAQQL